MFGILKVYINILKFIYIELFKNIMVNEYFNCFDISKLIF